MKGLLLLMHDMVKQLVMCQGLPASGKTSWAKMQTESSNDGPFIRVSKDDIRADLKKNGWVWSQANEAKDVLPERDRQIIEALNSGQSVISDDTNLQHVHKARLAQIAIDCGAELVVKKFDTTVDECIRRDAARRGDEHVGEKVIREMAKKYLNDYQGLMPYVADSSLPSCIICDLDGTLSDNHWRNPYDGSKCAEDPVVLPIRNIIEVYYRFMDWRIVYLSGRDGEFRGGTEEFLRKNHCPPGELFMRPAGDRRKDWVVKYELFQENVRNKFNVRFVLDDRDQVVKMWRVLGLTCLQVAEGAF